jgi:hypothetical protein
MRGEAMLLLHDGTSLIAEIEHPDDFDLMRWPPGAPIHRVIGTEMAKGQSIRIRIEWSSEVAPEDRGGHLWDITVSINDRPWPLPDHSRPHHCERECSWKQDPGAREIVYADGGPPSQA